MEEITVKTDNVSKHLFGEALNGDEEDELAFYMSRFNLDAESMQNMPALEEHVRSLLSENESDEVRCDVEDELAFFISKFNLDVETLHSMPALEEHVKTVLSKPVD